ncbi:MAG: sensor histidine kinase [Ktedonobacterales bacterium]
MLRMQRVLRVLRRSLREQWSHEAVRVRGAERGGPLGYARSIFTAPFRVDPAQIATLSGPQRELRRRAALLRLILSCLLGISAFVLLPAALLGQAAAASLVRLGLVIGLALACLLLNYWRRTTLAGLLLIFGTLSIMVHFLVTNPGGIDLQVVLTYALLAVLILISGLVAPGWATWLTALLVVVTTLAGIFARPFAPPLAHAIADPQQLRFAVAGPLVTLELFVAVLGWVSARSAGAAMAAAAQAFERERELASLKDQFITNVNHELRTPTMALNGYVKLLKLRHEQMKPERRAAIIEQAALAGDDLVSLLSSILDTQRLDQSAQALLHEAVDVRTTLEAAVRLVDPRAGGLAEDQSVERDLRMHVPAGLVVWAEPVRLRQVLTNLLSNAVKYSEPGTPVEVSAQVLEAPLELSRRRRNGAHAQPRMVEITVRDYGLGIPPEQAKLLFERFVRLPRDLASTVIGNGLGLHLCKSLVEAMGGHIWVESAGVPGEGATFHFTLPVAPLDTQPLLEATSEHLPVVVAP